jgi:CYTH domain-containing protein
MRHFEMQRQAGSRQIARAARRFDALAARLERELLSYRPRVAVLSTPAQSAAARAAAATVVARLLRTQADALRDQLALVRTRADEAPAHAARIEGKRLRYVLEPLRGMTRGAREAVDQLKQLQDALGELHDAHVLSGVTTEFASRAGAAALRTLVARREMLAFAALQRQWPASRVASLHAATCRVARALDARAHEGLEIERKFLLSGIPPEARRARHVTIDQGYLPGRVIGERIRRVRDGRRIDHVRSLKAGTGMVRMELEEKTPKAIFDGLWLLTKGRRLRKRRHVVPAGDLAWEIDVFLDRDLVLAEVEIPTEDTPIPIPDWLAPFIVREVTSERRFENHQLALARTRRPAKALSHRGGRPRRA